MITLKPVKNYSLLIIEVKNLSPRVKSLILGLFYDIIILERKRKGQY